ncbi:unnamed protein product [Rotaria sordida]|uniref:Uncharacterized protein n=1 Tax=Rotaria sordida TaxID=392033 RepID=A0A814S322_9BILA|nr:unnamed protein product [Rotaria sordida]
MASRNVNSSTTVADDVNSSTIAVGDVNSVIKISDNSNSLITANDDDNLWCDVNVMYESNYVSMTYERTTYDPTTSEQDQIKEYSPCDKNRRLTVGSDKYCGLSLKIVRYLRYERSTSPSACELEKELDQAKDKMRKLKEKKTRGRIRQRKYFPLTMTLCS